jgi:hypothetical protein
LKSRPVSERLLRLLCRMDRNSAFHLEVNRSSPIVFPPEPSTDLTQPLLPA